MTLAFALFAAQFVFFPGVAHADTTGSAEESVTIVNTVDFVDLEVNEVQSVWNNATGGIFTLSFEGQGPTSPLRYDAGLVDVDEVQTLYNNAGANEVQTLYNDATTLDEVQTLYNDATSGTFTITFDGQTTGPIAYNAPATGIGSIEEALQSLDNINDVTVTGTGVMGDPWVITYVDPGDQDVPEITTDDSLLVGGASIIATTTEGNDGGTFTISFQGQGPTGAIAFDAPATGVGSVEEALESLSNITDVTVSGIGDAGDPWVITFLDPGDQDVAEITTDDTSLNGTSTITTTTPGAEGGTFTISFDGQGPTNPINYDAPAPTVEGELEGLPNINDLTVTGTGVVGDPWVITFLDPGSQDVAQITTDDSGLAPGGSTSTIATTTQGNLSIETALEALPNINDVSVTGSGTSGDPWLVEFVDPGARHLDEMTVDDSLLTPGGSTTTIAEDTEAQSAPIDPSGIVYLSSSNNLLVADSEINEEPSVYDDVNLWEMTTSAVFVDTGTTFPDLSAEPTGLAYNAANQHIFVSDDNAKLIRDVDPGLDGQYGTLDDTWTTLDTTAIGITDPEDVTWDPTTGQIFIAGGLNATVIPVDLGANGMIGGGDDVVGTTMDFSDFIGDLEGIAYRAVSDTLLLSDVFGIAGKETIYEMTKDGRLVRSVDIGFTQTPADLVIAPASGGGGDNVYVVDRASDNGTADPPPRDGKLYELSVPFNNLAPFVDAGPDQAISISDPLTITGDTYDDGQPTTNPPSVTWSQVSGPPGGTATFGSPNSLSTTVTFDVVGGSEDPYVLELTSSDGSLVSEDTLQVLVFADDPPVANDDSASTNEDTAVNIDVLANDTDPDDDIDASTLQVISAPSGGSTQVKSDDTITYTPDPNFNGSDSFTYQICDLTLLCDTAKATITVDPVDDPPVANNDSASTNEDTAVNIDVLANDTDPDDDIDASTLQVISAPSGGSTQVKNDDTITYTPDTNFNGSDSFTYEVCDLTLLCDTAKVSITVNSVNDIPVANDDNANTSENTPVNIDVLANDTDPDNNIDPNTLQVISAPSNGSTQVKTDDTITYTPDTNFDGTDSFTYQICDLTSLCDTAKVSITVNSVNDIPVANDDNANTSENTPVNIDVLANDTDPDNNIDPNTLQVISAPSNGSTQVKTDDTITYTPDTNFDGTDSFTYQICDLTSLCDTAKATITVDPAGDVDTFIDDDGHTFENDIEWLAAEGITKGCNPPTNNEFCPDDFVTRGQMAAFLVRALGYTDNGGGDLFIDDNGSTFENDIDKLGTAGVTKGCNPPTNNEFCPDDFVTRGQMAAFLVRALGYTDNGGGDLFIDDNGSTFENDIDKLGTAGVTKGCNPPTNNEFCPDDFVTRGQMAAFLHRALGN